MVTPAVNSRAKPSLFPVALISLDAFLDLFSDWGSGVPRGVVGYRPLSTAIAALSGEMMSVALKHPRGVR